MPPDPGRLSPLQALYAKLEAQIQQLQQIAIKSQHAFQVSTPSGRLSQVLINKLTGQVRQNLLQAETVVNRLLVTEGPRTFTDAVRAAMPEGETFRLTQQESDRIQAEINHLKGQLTRAQVETEKDVKRYLKDVQRGQLGKQGRVKVPGSQASNYDVQRFMRLHGVRSITYSDGKRYKLDEFTKMQVQTTAQRLKNLGTIAAARQTNRMLQVHDSSECGWSSHHDPHKPNGTLVTSQEAGAYPVAHPHCVRTFTLARPERPDDRRKELARKGLAVTGVVAAAAAVGVGAAALAQNSAIVDMFKNFEIMALRGNPLYQYFSYRINELRGLFATGEAAPVIPIVPPTLPTTDLPLVVNAVTDAGNKFLASDAPVPTPVLQVLGVGENASREATGEAFKKFAAYKKMAEEVGDIVKEPAKATILNLAEFEARRRNLTQYQLLVANLKTQLRGAWTRYGPRAQINITDWLKARVHLPLETIRQLRADITGKVVQGKKPTQGISAAQAILKAAKATTKTFTGTFHGVAAQMKMFADGSFGGALSLIPKGPLRALVEVDQYGKLSGNIRLVPGGPWKVSLEFKLKGWDARFFGDGQGAIDFRQKLATDIQRAWDSRERARENVQTLERLITGPQSQQAIVQSTEYKAATKAFEQADSLYAQRFARLRDLEGFQFDIKQPRFRDLTHDLRQMELNRVIVEYNFGRMGPVQLAGRVQMPVATLKQWLRHPLNQTGDIFRNVDGSLSGVFRFVKNDLLNELRAIADVVQVTGKVQFSAFKRLPSQISASVDLAKPKLQMIAANMRIHGYSVFDTANVMNLSVGKVVEYYNETRLRLDNFMNYLGVTKPEDIEAAFLPRLENARKIFTTKSGNARNRQTLIKMAVDRMTRVREVTESVTTTSAGGREQLVTRTVKRNLTSAHTGVLRILAGIQKGDGVTVIESKLIALREFLRADQVDNQAIEDALDSIHRSEFKKLAQELSKVREITSGTQ